MTREGLADSDVLEAIQTSTTTSSSIPEAYAGPVRARVPAVRQQMDELRRSWAPLRA
jgi:hypothetical protein